MSRRTVLLGCLFVATGLTSTGCHGHCRPFLCRWHCGGCWPRFHTPAPVVSGPAMAAPMMASPAECECLSPASGPIAVSAPHHAPGPMLNGPPPSYGGPPTYTVPSVFPGQPSTLIPPPQVMKESPMPATPPTGGMK
jgi:hypothetical protein